MTYQFMKKTKLTNQCAREKMHPTLSGGMIVRHNYKTGGISPWLDSINEWRLTKRPSLA